MKRQDCPKLGDCEKLEEIRSFDPEKYDMQGLIEDICWLCDKKPADNFNSARGDIIVMCAWCGKELYRKPGFGQPGVSHGICLKCRKEHFPKAIVLSKILKYQREIISLTQRELAERSGISASYLCRIERGNRSPSARVLQKVARPLGVPEERLLEFAGYLSRQSSTTESETERNFAGLDPCVAKVLSQEPVEMQRMVLAILNDFKSMARK